MKRLALLLCCIPLFAGKVHSQCANADFSYGNFTNWTGSVGENDGTTSGLGYTAKVAMIIGTPNSSPYTAGQQTIMNHAGTDPNTQNLLSVLPPGGNYSCRLGNAQVEACDNSSYPQAAQLKYEMKVTPSNSMFEYQYAVVLQNPSHTASEQPRFNIQVLDSSGNNQIGGSCGTYNVVAVSGLPGFTTCSPSGSACESDDVEWKNWTTVGLDLSSYVNHKIILQFTAFDCTPGGHFGYAYIACSCESSAIIQQCSTTSDTLWAPPGFAQYLWTPGGQTTQYDIITNPVNGTAITCVCTAVTGCDLTLHDTLHIEPVKFSVNSDTICAGQVASLIAHDSTTSPYIPYTYNWSNSQTGDTIHVSPTATTTYTVTATATGGCYKTQQTTVVVNKVVANAGANITICPNSGSALLNASGSTGTAPLTYQWGNGLGVISTYDTVTVAPAGTTTYTVTVTANNGCSADTSITVNVANHLKIIVSTTNPTICSGGSVTLNASGAVNYVWSPGTGLNTNSGASVIATPSDTIIYTVTGTSSGCSADTTIKVNVTAKPSVYIYPVVSASCNLFNGSATASGGTSYIWSNGETSATDSSLAPGLYTVTVTNGGVSGCSSTDTVTIHALPSVHLSILSVDSVQCYGMNGSITVLASPSGGIYYYRYAGHPWQSSPTFSPLAPGVYNITVIDTVTKCKALVTEILSQPDSLISVASTVTPIKCYGTSAASATVSVTGGTASYSYEWSSSPVQTTQTATNLPVGVYTVTVTDYHHCTSIAMDTIKGPTQIGIILTADSVMCYGGITGGITAIDTGGTPTYTYLWSNNQTGKNLISVAAGIYTVTLTDHNGCTDAANAQVLQPSNQLIYSVATGTDTVINCGGSGFNIGAIDIDVSGGTPPYSYHWSNGSNSQNISNLNGGTYTVTITDHNLCTIVRTFIVSQPNPLITVASTVSPVLCYGLSDASATVNVTGGTTSYSYEWSSSPIQNTQNATNLPVGVYTVTVTDHNGCTNTSTVTITGPTKLYIALTADSAKCFGQADGGITSIDTGGTPTYSYSWSNGQTGQNLISVAGSTTGIVYTVTLTDHNGCTDVASAGVLGPTQLTYNIDSAGTDTILKCGGTGYDIGKISINVVGGTYPWSYLWNTIPPQTTQNIMNLSGPKTYTITITDHNGCSVTRTFFVSQPSPLEIHIDSINALCRDSSDGSITSSVTGGTPFPSGNYTYLWSTKPPQTTEYINNLRPGTYYLTVTDANGCIDSTSIGVGIRINLLASFTVAAPTPPYSPLPVTFNYTGSVFPHNLYDWTFGDGTVGTDSLDQTHTYTTIVRDSFKVCLTVIDSVCRYDTCRWVDVDVHSKLKPPNVFMPGDPDVNNSTFIVSQDTSDVRSIATFNCEIFDRWGKKVYEWSDISTGWDGGNYAEGTYYYIITAKGYDNITYNLHGAVLLLRSKK